MILTRFLPFGDVAELPADIDLAIRTIIDAGPNSLTPNRWEVEHVTDTFAHPKTRLVLDWYQQRSVRGSFDFEVTLDWTHEDWTMLAREGYTGRKQWITGRRPLAVQGIDAIRHKITSTCNRVQRTLGYGA